MFHYTFHRYEDYPPWSIIDTFLPIKYKYLRKYLQSHFQRFFFKVCSNELKIGIEVSKTVVKSNTDEK